MLNSYERLCFECLFTIQVLKRLSLMSVLLCYIKSTLLFQASAFFNILWNSYNHHVYKLAL